MASRKRIESTVRRAKSTRMVVLPIKPPFSNFDFHEDHFPIGFQKPETFRRICSQVRRLSGKTLVIEELEPSSDVLEENEDLRKMYPELLPGITRRISFFKKSFKSEAGLARIRGTDILGYVILKEEFLSVNPLIFETRIFESVLVKPFKDNNFIRGARTWLFKVGEFDFTVEGYIYAQQNGKTNCCAHVALRCAASAFHPKGDMSYREMNGILGIDHKNRFAWEGLSLNQQIKVLEAAGAKCIPAIFLPTPNPKVGKKIPAFKPPPFQKFVYGSIESGFPSVITFKTQKDAHAIPVFGHTFNQDTWVPLAEGSYFSTGGETTYIPSDSWLSMFIGHDDNFGSNVCIPGHYLKVRDPKSRSLNVSPRQVAYVITTLHPEIKVGPIFAELVGAHYLWHIFKTIPVNVAWCRRVYESVQDPKNPKNNRIVLRTRLIKGNQYSAHLSNILGWDGKDKIYASLLGPIEKYLSNDWIWIVEFSLLELFAGNLRKLGEIVVRADKSLDYKKIDLEGFLLARIPGSFVTIDKNTRVPTLIPSGINDHVKLYDC